MKLREWIPRRHYTERHRFCLQSGNGKLYLGLGSDIYSFQLQAGPLCVTWDAKEEDSDN